MGVEVLPYDEQWPAQFTTARDHLAEVLEGVTILGIEHVGSTSVPGLAAKPVIDIDIVVDEDVVERAVAALVAAGYSSRGELGIAGRHALAPPADSIRRNVYVTVAGCLALRNHIAVRATLRRESDLRDEYGAIKLALARELDDIDAYTAAKSDVLRRILGLAGLSDAELDEIEAANRA